MASTGYPTLANTEKHTLDDFHEALGLLSEELAKQPIPSREPLVLITSGDFLSMQLFHNRQTSEDLDYVLVNETHAPYLQQAFTHVCHELGWPNNWLSGNMSITCPTGDARDVWVKEAIHQNIIVYASDHLKIYAAKLQWCIASKMSRMASYNPGANLLSRGITNNNAFEPAYQAKRDADVDDIAHMLKMVLDKRRRGWFGKMRTALTRGEIRSWQQDGYPITDKTFEAVKEHYVVLYRKSPYQ
ncbi:hypothetical protein CYLTODRAFT_448001 [Cylindrobasidium torrendii FP15055 ss-10]|uniref:Uncharacterized protein n=1 Tax=Cylindrobasidium torrendii FP15055 ss-10 TaxID=1314674 RepID=A0A0D7BX77_9AGAR|nr:hypothetical protein CYLTODRAFT_448001 [Cylindrobasidium torrendii FP15055 ss-10]